ncbi:basic proline-rich protein-like isoform X2 [Talpa occidentalis]|uniref:basic proline-rich protein-like isoform X2 n=1 Tax=Talpa occidentalis TaxID=50954 RepID=UPI0023F81B61|nr:basic proline-rich protein-like isoform X2 [Talpa occidentalis]
MFSPGPAGRMSSRLRPRQVPDPAHPSAHAQSCSSHGPRQRALADRPARTAPGKPAPLKGEGLSPGPAALMSPRIRPRPEPHPAHPSLRMHKGRQACADSPGQASTSQRGRVVTWPSSADEPPAPSPAGARPSPPESAHVQRRCSQGRRQEALLSVGVFRGPSAPLGIGVPLPHWGIGTRFPLGETADSPTRKARDNPAPIKGEASSPGPAGLMSSRLRPVLKPDPRPRVCACRKPQGPAAKTNTP